MIFPILRRSFCLFVVFAALVSGTSLHAQLASSPALPRGDAKVAGFDSVKLTSIDAVLNRAVAQRQIAGGAVLVARQGKTIHLATAGLQDAEAGAPISDATIYRIASMTKPITSVAVMMLVEEGKLRLDDSLAKYIPEFASARMLVKDARPDQPLDTITAAANPPTIRQLLNHTSGVTYGLWDRPILGKLYREARVSDGLIETPGTIADNARRLAKMPLLFQPGSAWEYGLNTDLLGRVVEVASGQSLEEFFQTRIFQPLAMRDTHFALPVEKRSRLAALYTADGTKQLRRVGDGPQELRALRYSATYPLSDGNQYQSGGAGLVSTIGDYARFLQMLLGGGRLDGQRLLKAETVAEMTRNQIDNFVPFIAVHGEKFGYGFGVVTPASKPAEVASVGSYSWGGIFHTYFLVDPARELIVLSMTQIYPFDHLTLHNDVKRAVYAALTQ
jgi:CubicO group peptidase (beta-lactamase class C family)